MTITTPGAEVEVGQRFFVNGGLAFELRLERDLRRASLSFASWASRLGLPASASAAVAPDPMRLHEALANGTVHGSLVEEPRELAA